MKLKNLGYLEMDTEQQNRTFGGKLLPFWAEKWLDFLKVFNVLSVRKKTKGTSKIQQTPRNRKHKINRKCLQQTGTLLHLVDLSCSVFCTKRAFFLILRTSEVQSLDLHSIFIKKCHCDDRSISHCRFYLIHLSEKIKTCRWCFLNILEYQTIGNWTSFSFQ